MVASNFQDTAKKQKIDRIRESSFLLSLACVNYAKYQVW